LKAPINPQLLVIVGLIVILSALLLAVFGWAIILWWGQPPAVQVEPAGAPGLPATRASQPAISTYSPLYATLQPPAAPVPLQSGASPAAPLATQVAVQVVTPFVPPPTVIPSTVDIDALLAQMSLEEKIGQMLLSGIPGEVFGVQAGRLVSQYHIGGVVYFGENTHTAAQALRLSQDLQAAAAASAHAIPLFIAVDHEGGKVFRFRQDLTHFPNFMALGAANSPDVAALAASAAAQELRAVGINTSLGPDLDVNNQPFNPVIGVRSLGSFPERVAQIGAAYLQGLQAGGVIGAVKHFPGHGATLTDSHTDLPLVDKTAEQLAQEDLAPFKIAIAQETGMVMVAHIAYPHIDPSRAPASLSPVIIGQLLRQQLGYDGVVVTDAMSMGAIASRYPPDQAAVLAAQAGCDLLAYTSAETAIAAYQALLSATQDGRLPVAQVDASVRRVLRLKARYGLFAAASTGLPLQADAHRALAYQIARQSITLSGQAQAPLLNTTSLLLVTPDVLSSGVAAGDGSSYLGDLLRARGVQVDEWIYSVEDAGQTAALTADVQRALPAYPLVLVVTWDALLRQRLAGSQVQVTLLQALFASDKPVILVAGSSPYDLSLAAGRPALALYGGLEPQLEALVDTLLAGQLPTGVLPVALP